MIRPGLDNRWLRGSGGRLTQCGQLLFQFLIAPLQQGHFLFLGLRVGVGLHTLGFQSHHLLLQLLDLLLADQMMGLGQFSPPPGCFQAFSGVLHLLLNFLPLGKGGTLGQLLHELIPLGSQSTKLAGQSLHLLLQGKDSLRL
jgi:hypothetical protein